MEEKAASGRQGRPEERRRLTDGALEYATNHGLATLSLRPLAATLDTSDRMLIYYFASRDGVIAAVLERLTDNLRRLLAQTVPSRQLAAPQLLDHVWRVVSAPELRSSLALYLEVDVLAARGIEPFTATADAATATWLEWLEEHLDAPDDAKATVAAALMTLIDGLLLQTAAHPSVPAGPVYRWISDSLANHRGVTGEGAR